MSVTSSPHLDIQLSKEHLRICLGAATLGMQYLFTNGFFVMGARSRVFTKEFMSQFNKQHQQAFHKDAADMGYPDIGCGRYSKQLPYQDWYAMNNGQRAQMNSLE